MIYSLPYYIIRPRIPQVAKRKKEENRRPLDGTGCRTKPPAGVDDTDKKRRDDKW
ncbi:MAG: hypothetical protein HFF15_09420 [Angelakisella sp.]|nr:hypothetical protein [Angelakisella sp.]